MRSIRLYNGLSLVPNIEGFRFRGWLHNGDLIACVVRKNELGMHYAVEETTGQACYDALKGWCEYQNLKDMHE